MRARMCGVCRMCADDPGAHMAVTIVTDWRRVPIYTHRWLGIVGCLIFLMWFASGAVMMYERMPRLTAEARLARIPTLDTSGIRVALVDAARNAAVVPDRVRAGMLLDRPVYRLESGGEWTTVFADPGETLSDVSSDRALAIVKAFAPEHAATASHAGPLEEPDQWTLEGELPRFLPMHRIALGDDSGTFLYVSERTGEPVMKTTSRLAWHRRGFRLLWTWKRAIATAVRPSRRTFVR